MTATEAQIGLAAISIVGSVGGAFLGAWLGFRSFRSQRWWDRKCEAYMVIFDAINVAVEENDPLWQAQLESRDLDSAYKAELASASAKAWKEIRRLSRIGDFLISQNSKKILDHLLERIEVSTQADTYFEHIDQIGAALNDALRDLRESARADLKL